ncbi:hypothetical protein ACFWUZ_33265 [Streptomyces sp. NPDC058646]|uniref:hypothetical protein n=1 Tax=Streptomyces sp. NPDC058646 TaxID=3346574 RepID=UPI00364EA4B2
MRTGDGARVTVAGLMRAAFQPHQSGKAGGPLADAAAEGGEPEVASSASHRTVDFHDPIEEGRDHPMRRPLLRHVERAKRRQSTTTT